MNEHLHLTLYQQIAHIGHASIISCWCCWQFTNLCLSMCCYTLKHQPLPVVHNSGVCDHIRAMGSEQASTFSLLPSKWLLNQNLYRTKSAPVSTLGPSVAPSELPAYVPDGTNSTFRPVMNPSVAVAACCDAGRVACTQIHQQVLIIYSAPSLGVKRAMMGAKIHLIKRMMAETIPAKTFFCCSCCFLIVAPWLLIRSSLITSYT